MEPAPRLDSSIILEPDTQLIRADTGLTVPLLPRQTGFNQNLAVFDPYDENKVPPAMEIAILHQNCTRFGKVVPADLRTGIRVRCPCCHMSLRDPYSLQTQSKDLKSLGPVIPMFLHLSYHLAIFCIFAAVAQVPFWLSQGWKAGLLDWSLQNQNTSGRWLVFLYSLLLYCGGLAWFWRYHIAAQLFSIDIKAEMAERMGQRSILVCDLSEGSQQTSEYIKSLLHQRTWDFTAKPNIIQISVGKFMAKIIKINQKIKDSDAAVLKIHQNMSSMLDSQVKAYQLARAKEISELKQQLYKDRERFTKVLENSKSAVHHHSIALVTFATKKQADAIIKSSRLEFIKFYFSNLCKHKKPKYHHIWEAPEPNDIIWENIGVSSIGQFSRMLVANLVFLGLYAVSLSVQLSGVVLEKRMFRDLVQQAGESGFWTYLLSLKLFSATVTQVTNLFFSKALRKITLTQGCLSHSETYLRHTKKLIFAQLFNTISTVVGLSFLSDDYGGFQELPEKFMGQLIANLIFSSLLNPFSFAHLIRQIKIYFQVTRHTRAGKPVLLTQGELKKLMELPKIDLAARYATNVRTFLLSCFCVTILPASMWICVLFLLLQNRIDHYLIIQRYRFTKRLHDSYAKGINETAELGGYCAILGHLVFSMRADLELRSRSSDHPSIWVQVVAFCLASLISLISVSDFSANRKSTAEELGSNQGGHTIFNGMTHQNKPNQQTSPVVGNNVDHSPKTPEGDLALQANVDSQDLEQTDPDCLDEPEQQ